jgi:hypothetical protein
MAKEDFLKKLKLDFLIKEKTNSVNKEILTVLDYWTDKKPNFAHDMMKYYWLEKYGPRFLKLFWAHHKFYVYKRKTR